MFNCCIYIILQNVLLNIDFILLRCLFSSWRCHPRLDRVVRRSIPRLRMFDDCRRRHLPSASSHLAFGRKPQRKEVQFCLRNSNWTWLTNWKLKQLPNSLSLSLFLFLSFFLSFFLSLSLSLSLFLSLSISCVCVCVYVCVCACVCLLRDIHKVHWTKILTKLKLYYIGE